MDVDHLVELVLRHRSHGRVARDPRVVDHHVERAEVVDSAGDERAHVGRTGYVAARGRDPGPTEPLGRVLGGVQVQVAEDDLGAFGDEPFGDRETDSPRASGDDRGAAVEQCHAFLPSLWPTAW